MITSHRLSNTSDRAEALNYIKGLKATNPNFTLVDVGGSANLWTKEYVTHVVDFSKSEADVQHFLGNITDVEVWNQVLEYVAKNGKFSFATCTHTLEDISSPVMVCNMLSKIAHEGYIAIPSKYVELSHPEGQWLGFIHHRWIYDVKNNTFLGYPKQNFLEHMSYIHDWANKNQRYGREELQFFWKDQVGLKVINDDYLGPNTQSVINYYTELVS